jgi:hypothetical protein
VNIEHLALFPTQYDSLIVLTFSSEKMKSGYAIKNEDFKLYETLQIFTINLNGAFRHVKGPVILIGLLFIAVSLVHQTIRHATTLKFPASIQYPLSVLAVAAMSASLHESSGKIHQFSSEFVNQKTMSPYVNRKLKSFSCIKIYVGSCYYMTRLTFIAFCDAWIGNTIWFLEWERVV